MAEIYKFYDNLFQHHDFKKYNKLTELLLDLDFDFFHKFSQQNGNQIGGNHKTKIIKYQYKNYTFTIYQDHMDDRIAYSIKNNHNPDTSEICMLMFIPLDDKYVYLQTISYYDNCASPDMPKTKGGSLLLDATLAFINKIKIIYHMKYIQLRDTSTFICKDKQKTSIANLYMLTKGDTWYGSRGFVPFDPINHSLDINGLVNYKLNQKLIKLIKVKHTNLHQYMTKAITKPHLSHYNKSTIHHLLNDYSNKSIQEFFYDFTRKYDKTCDMFNEIYKQLMDDIGLVDMHGKSFYKLI